MGTRTTSTTPDPMRVLLVDSRHDRRGVMRMVIESGAHAGTVVAQAETATSAVAALATAGIDAAVVELQMPIDAGLAAVTALREARPALTIVVCTFRGDAPSRERALAAGADAFVVKPVSSREIQAACRRPGAGAPTALASLAT